jgi:hypothetical protein
MPALFLDTHQSSVYPALMFKMLEQWLIENWNGWPRVMWVIIIIAILIAIALKP